MSFHSRRGSLSAHADEYGRAQKGSHVSQENEQVGRPGRLFVAAVGLVAITPVVEIQICHARSMPGRAGGGKPSGQLGRERLQELDEGDECQMASQEYGDDDCRDKDERQEWRPPLPPRLVVIVVPLAHPPSMVGRAGGSKPLGLYSGAGEATKRHSVHTQLMTRTWSPLKRHAKSETTRDTTLQL